MDFFDLWNTVKYYIGRFFWPALFLIVGFILLKMSLIPNMEELNNGTIIEVKQNPGFRIAAFFFLIAGVVWFLYLFGLIKSFIGYAVMGIMVVLSGILIYSDYKNIKDTVDFNAACEVRDLDIKARMGDIKAAELAYKEMNGSYTNSMDDLIRFVKSGEKMKIQKVGKVPERKITPEERDYLYDDNRPIDKLMTETEAFALSKSPLINTFPTDQLAGFKRDTIFVPVMDAIFLDEKYTINRDKIGASIDFYADSLKYVPHSKLEVKLDTASIIKGEIRVATLYIEMAHPLNDQLKDPVMYSIGAIDDNHLRESWKSE